MKPIRSLLLPTFSLASTALGQVVVAPTDATTTRGFLSAAPLAITIGQPAPGTGLDELLFKDTGDQSTQPARKTTKPQSNLTPDYRLSVMFGAHAGLVVLDAISSGNDQLVYDASGVFQGDAMGGWATLVVTVDHNAQGATGGPLWDRRASGADVGGDIYSYGADDSQGMEDAMLGLPMLEIPREAVNLPAGTDVQSIDLFLPMIAANGGTSDPLFQNTTNFYFSLTSASAASLAPLWNLAINGATILKIVWTPGTSTTAGHWSAPQVFFSSNDLGLTAEDDVDALALATTNIPNWFNGTPIIVSTTHPTRNQILALINQGTPNRVLVPLQGGGGPITAGIKLIGTDNVTGLAGMDPDYGNWSKRIGAPIEPSRETAPSGLPNPATSLTRPGTRPLGLSVIATTSGHCSSFRSDNTVQVTGWGIPGVANQSAGTIYFAIAPEPTHLISDLTYLTFVPRGANQHRVQLSMPVPPGISGDVGIIAMFAPSNGSMMTWSPIAMMGF